MSDRGDPGPSALLFPHQREEVHCDVRVAAQAVVERPIDVLPAYQLSTHVYAQVDQVPCDVCVVTADVVLLLDWIIQILAGAETKLADLHVRR